MTSKLIVQMSVLSAESRMKLRLGRYHLAELESKTARTHIDDKGYNLKKTVLIKQFRPGQWDDEIDCFMVSEKCFFE